MKFLGLGLALVALATPGLSATRDEYLQESIDFLMNKSEANLQNLIVSGDSAKAFAAKTCFEDKCLSMHSQKCSECIWECESSGFVDSLESEYENWKACNNQCQAQGSCSNDLNKINAFWGCAF